MLPADTLSLCLSCLAGQGYRERVEAAGAAGFNGVILRPTDWRQAQKEGFDAGSARRLLEDCGLQLTELEALMDWLPEADGGPPPDHPWVAGIEERHFVELHETLGGAALTCALPVEGQPEVATAGAALAQLGQRWGARGLDVNLEFLPWTGCPNVAVSRQWLEASRQSNVRLLFDSWHFQRGDNSLEELAGLGNMVGSIQLSDAPASSELPMLHETMAQRQLPGEGDIPLVELLQLLRDGGCVAPVSVEVLSEAMRELPPVEAAKRCADATWEVLAKAGYPGDAQP